MFAFTWHKPLHPNLKDSGRELEDFLARRRCCTGKVTCCAPILCLKFDWKRRTVVTAEKNGGGGGIGIGHSVRCINAGKLVVVRVNNIFKKDLLCITLCSPACAIRNCSAPDIKRISLIRAVVDSDAATTTANKR